MFLSSFCRHFVCCVALLISEQGSVLASNFFDERPMPSTNVEAAENAARDCLEAVRSCNFGQAVEQFQTFVNSLIATEYSSHFLNRIVLFLRRDLHIKLKDLYEKGCLSASSLEKLQNLVKDKPEALKCAFVKYWKRYFKDVDSIVWCVPTDSTTAISDTTKTSRDFQEAINNWDFGCAAEKLRLINTIHKEKFGSRLHDLFCFREKLVTMFDDMDGSRFKLEVGDISYIDSLLSSVENQKDLVCKLIELWFGK